jgi:ribonuclease P protein component
MLRRPACRSIRHGAVRPASRRHPSRLRLILPAVQRLQSRPQFQAAMAGGIVSRTPHFALHRLVLGPAGAPRVAPAAPDGAPPPAPDPRLLFAGHPVWIGALVPKRWARRAVTRNAIRRQVYALCHDRAVAAAGTGEPLRPAAYVVRLRTAFDRKQFVSAVSPPLRQAVRTELQELLSRIATQPRRTADAPPSTVSPTHAEAATVDAPPGDGQAVRP